MLTFTCSTCHETKAVYSPGNISAPEYGKDDKGNLHCWACCSERKRQRMRDTGRATLYLVRRGDGFAITNWTGGISIEPFRVRIGRHNIARTRYDVWFTFESQSWHGVQYGEMTQICHCHRIKAK